MAELKHPELVYDVGMKRGEDTEFYLKKGYALLVSRLIPCCTQHTRCA